MNGDGDINISGNVTIGGLLTYEDVTNIDSVGLITARSGIEVTGGGLNVDGDIQKKGNAVPSAVIVEHLHHQIPVYVISGQILLAKRQSQSMQLLLECKLLYQWIEVGSSTPSEFAPCH